MFKGAFTVVLSTKDKGFWFFPDNNCLQRGGQNCVSQDLKIVAEIKICNKWIKDKNQVQVTTNCYVYDQYSLLSNRNTRYNQ